MLGGGGGGGQKFGHPPTVKMFNDKNLQCVNDNEMRWGGGGGGDVKTFAPPSHFIVTDTLQNYNH